MSLKTPITIRMLQRKLYQKAKEEPSYRFYLLYDKMYRKDVLAHAWVFGDTPRSCPGSYDRGVSSQRQNRHPPAARSPRRANDSRSDAVINDALVVLSFREIKD